MTNHCIYTKKEFDKVVDHSKISLTGANFRQLVQIQEEAVMALETILNEDPKMAWAFATQALERIEKIKQEGEEDE